MPYGVRDDVKEWLTIPSSTATHDAEIDGLIDLVDDFIDEYLRAFGTVPITIPLATEDTVIKEISNIWAAGHFNERHNGNEREHPWVTQAKLIMGQHILSRYGGAEAKTFTIQKTIGLKGGDTV